MTKRVLRPAAASKETQHTHGFGAAHVIMFFHVHVPNVVCFLGSRPRLQQGDASLEDAVAIPRSRVQPLPRSTSIDR